MRKLNFFLDRNSLQNIYFAFVRPIMEYADVVWDNLLSTKLMNWRNSIGSGRIVTGTTKLVSIHNS